MTAEVTNRYAASCHACGRTVAVGEGLLTRIHAMDPKYERWIVRHRVCPKVEPRMIPTDMPDFYASRHDMLADHDPWYEDAFRDPDEGDRD